MNPPTPRRPRQRHPLAIPTDELHGSPRFAAWRNREVWGGRHSGFALGVCGLLWLGCFVGFLYKKAEYYTRFMCPLFWKSYFPEGLIVSSCLCFWVSLWTAVILEDTHANWINESVEGFRFSLCKVSLQLYPLRVVAFQTNTTWLTYARVLLDPWGSFRLESLWKPEAGFCLKPSSQGSAHPKVTLREPRGHVRVPGQRQIDTDRSQWAIRDKRFLYSNNPRISKATISSHF